MSTKDVRLANLRLLLEEESGAKAKLASRIKKSPAQLSQWLSGYRTISEETAREIERAAKKPASWLDGPAATRPAAPAAPQLADALPVVLDALRAVDPTRQQELLDTLAMCVRYGSDSDRQRLTELLGHAPGKHRSAA